MSKLNKIILLTFWALIAGGCSFNAGFNSTYLPPAGVTSKINESVLVIMTQEEQDWVYSGNPTSFTGGATTLSVPLGDITKQIALEVFSRHFQKADLATELPEQSPYKLMVNPRVQHFEYAYNQLKNLGFAITPEVKIDLDVTFYDQSGNEILKRTYESGLRSGSSYMVSGAPSEKINQAIHETLYDLLDQAAKEVIQQL